MSDNPIDLSLSIGLGMTFIPCLMGNSYLLVFDTLELMFYRSTFLKPDQNFTLLVFKEERTLNYTPKFTHIKITFSVIREYGITTIIKIKKRSKKFLPTIT